MRTPFASTASGQRDPRSCAPPTRSTAWATGPLSSSATATGPVRDEGEAEDLQAGGGRILRKTGADLYFKSIPGQGRYWKFKHAATFRLYRLNRNGSRVDLVEVGPKQIYCLRDLEHSHPGMTARPNSRVYPSCSQDPNRQTEHARHLGGLVRRLSQHLPRELDRAERHPQARAATRSSTSADPDNGIFEKNENNNQASTVVFLTRNGGAGSRAAARTSTTRRCRRARRPTTPRSRTGSPSCWGGATERRSGAE